MARVTLTDAVKALDDRKDAVFGGDHATRSTGDEMNRLMFHGTGIDPEEAWAMAQQAAEVVTRSLAAGEIDQGVVLQCCWLDGVLAGATFARLAVGSLA